jgi:hypothetical protein
MRSESFYTTVAQVLPTLFIAMALELISLRRMAQEAGLIPEPEELERQYASDSPPINYPAIIIALIGILTFVGETSAILVLLVGTHTWLPILAGPICTFAVLAVTLLVSWIHWVRIVQNRV